MTELGQRRADLHQARTHGLRGRAHGVKTSSERLGARSKRRDQVVIHGVEALCHLLGTVPERTRARRDLIRALAECIGGRGDLIETGAKRIRTFGQGIIALVKHHGAISRKRQGARLAMHRAQDREQVVLPQIATDPLLHLLQRCRAGARGEDVLRTAGDDIDRGLDGSAGTQAGNVPGVVGGNLDHKGIGARLEAGGGRILVNKIPKQVLAVLKRVDNILTGRNLDTGICGVPLIKIDDGNGDTVLRIKGRGKAPHGHERNQERNGNQAGNAQSDVARPRQRGKRAGEQGWEAHGSAHLRIISRTCGFE